ncbi:hypothetical protein [Kitasatospora sp. NPDC090091]|uniref:hypothetical protein n=1 Tax=Kitasatospora sp. NPDC090091 TaxID=3364081 RepID=UPI00381E1B8E
MSTGSRLEETGERAGYPPVALVVTGAGPVAPANRQEAVADLSVETWGGRWCPRGAGVIDHGRGPSPRAATSG